MAGDLFPDDAALVEDCIASFGDHPEGHPDMWRHWHGLLGDRNTEGARNWLCAWSYIRWADNLLDRADTPEAFSETLAWGMGRLRSLLNGDAPENRREAALVRFLTSADPSHVELFLKATAAAEFEKSQLAGAPAAEALEKIIHYNAVLPVLLHCRLFLEPCGLSPERVTEFGTSFGQVTRYADVFVDLEEDLDAGIIPISREACERLGISPVGRPGVDDQRRIRVELAGDYREHRDRAGAALASLGVDRRMRFAYGTVLQAFDHCVYGALRSVPRFAGFLLRHVDQAVPLTGFVIQSMLVSQAERAKVGATVDPPSAHQ